MNLMELSTLLLGLATVLATSVAAYVVWHQWRGAVQVEWESAWHNMYENSIPPRLDIKITVRNDRKFGVKGMRVEVSGCPVKNVMTGSANSKKHESWRPYQAPLMLDIEPGGSKSCAVFVFPDWASLAKRISVKWRPKSSTALRVQTFIASKSRKRWIAKNKTTIIIPNEMIAKAATVSNAI